MRVETEAQSQQIPVHEGILLDRDGNAIGGDTQSRHQSRTFAGSSPLFEVKGFKRGGLLGPVLGILALTAFAFAGVTLISFLLIAWAVYLIVRGILGIFGLGSSSAPRSRRYPTHYDR